MSALPLFFIQQLRDFVPLADVAVVDRFQICAQQVLRQRMTVEFFDRLLQFLIRAFDAALFQHLCARFR